MDIEKEMLNLELRKEFELSLEDADFIERFISILSECDLSRDNVYMYKDMKCIPYDDNNYLGFSDNTIYIFTTKTVLVPGGFFEWIYTNDTRYVNHVTRISKLKTSKDVIDKIKDVYHELEGTRPKKKYSGYTALLSIATKIIPEKFLSNERTFKGPHMVVSPRSNRLHLKEEEEE